MSNFQVQLKVNRQKGDLDYEYHPFRNLQLSQDDERGKKGTLVDFDTDKLNFDLNHPVEIEVQPSYDGSVNLILNDDKNIPRLINSRFSVRENGTYEIVDRIGENDTNVYGSDTLDKDSSLYLQYGFNPIVSYEGFVSGKLPVGQYCFYFTYCDKDDNESDYIAETGVIPVFIGEDGDAVSMDGGIKNQESNKGIKLKLSNLKDVYNYLKVTYVRYFADNKQNRVSEAKKIIQKYPINSETITIQITGTENSEIIDPAIINVDHFIANSVKTQAQCKNMLFQANLVKNADNYRELQDLALRIVPQAKEITNKIDYKNSENIVNKVGYMPEELYRFGVVFIYNNGTLSRVYNTLGYNMNGTYTIGDYMELYQYYKRNYKDDKKRLGDLGYEIIDELQEKINEEFQIYKAGISDFVKQNYKYIQYKEGSLKETEGTIEKRKYISIDHNGMISNKTNEFFEKPFFKSILKSYQTASYIETIELPDVTHINAKGVCKMPQTTNPLYVEFTIPDEVKDALKELGIRGYFFVRQKRLPLAITQLMILPLDTEAQIPIYLSERKNNNGYIPCSETLVGQEPYNRKLFNYRGKYRTLYYDGSHTYTDINGKQKCFFDNIGKEFFVGVCPDFLLNQPYYNQIFNGSDFILQKVGQLNNIEVHDKNRRYIYSHLINHIDSKIKVKICSVTEDVKTVTLGEQIFRLYAGSAEQMNDFKLLGQPFNEDDQDKTNIIRGNYSPYLAIQKTDKENISLGDIYNVYPNNYQSEINQQFLERMNSAEPFYAISNKYNFSDSEIRTPCYKGDCYYNEFTYRLNRNFNDPTLANNDKIIKENGKAFPTDKDDVSLLQTTEESYYIVSLKNGDTLAINYDIDCNKVIYFSNNTVTEYEIINRNGTLNESDVTEIYFGDYKVTFHKNTREDYSGLYNSVSQFFYLVYLQKVEDGAITDYISDGYFDLFNTFINQRPLYYIISDNDKKVYFKDKPEEQTTIDLSEAPIYAYWEPSTRRSDVNAVQMGTWITFNCYSSTNYALRSVDHSYVAEEALMGSPRTFYPKITKPWLGTFKMPDSYLYNDAFRASLGYRQYFTLDDINYLKNTFSNRIQYSSIAIQDSFKNNYRESLNTYFRDYSTEYGSITRLVGFEGYLLVIFEHGIGVAVINERVLAGGGDGEPVFINTNNVLPEELTIISDTYGTIWSESVVKSEKGYVYGVDTVAKKIWRVAGQQIEIISDLKVNKFLINNITLGEREKTPIIGLRNVKSHYNNYKKDVMFTFYDSIYKDEEKAWNLCFNEDLNQFTTFYSWIPSHSANIDTQFFTFNRQVSKDFALAKRNIESTGVTLSSSYLEDLGSITISYNKTGINEKLKINEDGTTEVITDDQVQKLEQCKFRLEKDHFENYKKVELVESTNNEGKLIYTLKAKEDVNDLKSFYLEITPYLSEILPNGMLSNTYFKTEQITLIHNPEIKYGYNNWFYLHGNSGIFSVSDDLKPCYWYDQQHPFEIEFVVNDKIGQQKLFQNLVIISNKAEPESFHFEIEGDNYDFSEDKRAMYFRQEATKELYQNMGSNILFNREYKKFLNRDKDDDPIYLEDEQYYRLKNEKYISQYIKSDRVYPIYEKGLFQQVKSTIFPLYYERIDTYDQLYHDYSLMEGNKYDFKNLSGSEISWDKDLNQFNIITHIKNSPIPIYGRLRGNSYYKEGKWNVQIPSITYMQKNESEWPNKVPPVIINSVPKDVETTDIYKDMLPNIWNKTDNIGSYVKNTTGWTKRKETKIRDKWIKVRIRYSGRNLAVIHSVITLYDISYG